MSTARSAIAKIHHFCNQPRVEILLVLLVAVIILRIPNFAEPYWYGDEGIYLTIGQALRQGSRLYVDIVDHKTPIIYYLSMVSTQFNFRLLLLAWMLVTTSLFYFIAWKWLKTRWPVVMASIAFVLFTTVPWLEGNIPNGELFVMGFVLAGGALLTRTRFWSGPLTIHVKPKELLWLGVSGLLFGLGILTKVPALFDLVAFMALGWFSFTHSTLTSETRNWRTFLPSLVKYQVALGAGVAVAIAASAIYFLARGSGQAYLDFGLLYNFRYAGNWTLPFTHPLLLLAFSLPGKALITLVIGLGLTWSTKWLKPLWPTLILWVVLALFASTLSNRPYAHYMMQMVPPAALALGYIVKLCMESARKRGQLSRITSFQVAASIISLIMVLAVWLLLRFSGYPALSYYTKFVGLVTGRLTSDEYANSFNSVLAENRDVAAMLTQHPDRYLLIWGTNPMLYAMSGKQPVGRFTVVFHIKDFDAYQETLTALKDKHPYYVVVMKDERSSFPELNQYLQHNYLPNLSYEHMTLWKLR